MFGRFFKAPTCSNGAWSTFSNDALFMTDQIVSYEYTKRLTKSGQFSLVLPFERQKLGKLELMGTVCMNDSDWLMIENISYDGKRITLSGKDMKGLLDTRIALYGASQGNAADGYDIASGTTAQCIKHYLDFNCISPADSKRALPIVWYGGASGLQSDSYMARFEFLSDIISELCDNAGIGYDIRGYLSGSGFRFFTIQGVDRSFAQSVRPRVIFSAAWGNVRSQSFEHGVDNLINAVYATDTNEVTTTVFRDNSEQSGVFRRESNVSVGVPYTDEYFSKYAIKEVSDNVESHSYKIEAAVTSGYGTAWDLGDTVTVRDDYTGNKFDAVITEATKSYSAGQQGLTVVLGQQKQKPLQKIVNNLLSGTARRR